MITSGDFNTHDDNNYHIAGKTTTTHSMTLRRADGGAYSFTTIYDWHWTNGLLRQPLSLETHKLLAPLAKAASEAGKTPPCSERIRIHMLDNLIHTSAELVDSLVGLEAREHVVQQAADVRYHCFM